MTNHHLGKVPAVATNRDPLHRRRTSLLFMMLAATTVAVGGCSSDTTGKDAPSPANPHLVVFYAEGDGTTTGAVTLATETGGTIQKDVRLPMVDEGTGKPGVPSDRFKTGAHLYISVQNKEAAGKVTCRIEAGGKVIDQASSEGPYKVVTCRGTMP